ncbi:M23 family metallopeptidase [Sphingomonas quercus]|uniref:M23 family metallopeptidase n=1 Tax=Sphingomonas quercus TaxID=2842451 RepID=UPI00209B26D5|nr:M23 family metallopeptidase [Sphingomonas quercus]
MAGCVAPSAPPRTAMTAPAPPPAAPVTPPPAPLPGPVLTGERIQGGLIHGTAPAGTQIILDGKPVPTAPDGRFIIAFDRDAGPQATLIAILPDGRRQTETLAVAPRAWEIEELPIPKGTSPSPEFLRIRGEELRQIAAARAIGTDAAGWTQSFHWPITGRISGLFGSQRVYRGEKGAYHSGTDVARPAGTPVAAPADGVVILAADHPFTLEGNLLMVDHGMGLNSSFLHLSRIDVKPGDHVRQGQIIGAVGMTGRATGPHLHWSLKWRDARIDPLLLAGPMPAG